MMDIAILENIQREDLSPIELAEGFNKYMENTGLTQEEIATKFGKSRSYITNSLGLLRLPKSVQEQINRNKISASHARVLSKIDDDDLIITLAEKIVSEGMSVRELEKLCSSEEISKKKPINRVIVRPTKYNSYENIMRDKLGTKVMISKNKITIPFDSDGDLGRILEILKIDLDDE
jgi:ParB family chromosome partitioning protein